MSSRREPLLWLQCLAIGAIPLEVLMLRMVLAGADFGPVPGLERVFTWAIGALVPAVLLWQRSPDWASLLLVRQPLAGRSDFQRQCSAAQSPLPIKVLGASGAVVLLILLWWIDGSALLISDLSPLQNGSRLGSLLLAAPLLTLLLWQWQQLIQAAWLLTREDSALSTLTPFTDADYQRSTASFGLGLLKLGPLEWDLPVPSDTPEPAAVETPQGDADAAEQTEPVEAPADEDVEAAAGGDNANREELPSVVSGTVEPEQSTEEHNGADLNAEISEDDTVTSADPEAHDEQPEAAGGEESDPDQPPETSPGGA